MGKKKKRIWDREYLTHRGVFLSKKPDDQIGGQLLMKPLEELDHLHWIIEQWTWSPKLESNPQLLVAFSYIIINIVNAYVVKKFDRRWNRRCVVILFGVTLVIKLVNFLCLSESSPLWFSITTSVHLITPPNPILNTGVTQWRNQVTLSYIKTGLLGTTRFLPKYGC